jgi:hypothetical protein
MSAFALPETHVELTLSSEEGDSGTFGAGTTCTTNAVNIILRVVGIVIVQHMSNISDIFENSS